VGIFFLDNFYSVLYQSKILEFENECPLNTPSTEIENNIFGVQKENNDCFLVEKVETAGVENNLPMTAGGWWWMKKLGL